MMRRQLIVTDLDGTLLNGDHEVSAFDREWIDTFQKNNGRFTFATGRMNASVGHLVKECHVTMPIITYNGAQMYCPVENKRIYAKSFTLSKMMKKLLMVAARTFAEVLFFANDHVYTLGKGRQIHAFEQKEKIDCTLITADEIPLHMTKIIVMSEEADTLTRFEQQCTELFSQVDFVYSEPNYLEILPEAVSKGIALARLKEYVGLEDYHTTGFGNHLNDMSLLQAADTGVAVKNAEERLKEVADEIAPHTNEAGAVGHYIKQLFKQVEQRKSEGMK